MIFGFEEKFFKNTLKIGGGLDAVGQGPAFVLESKAPLAQARSNVGLELAAVSTSRLRYPPPALPPGRRLL